MTTSAQGNKDAAQMIVESINPEVRKILRRNALNTIKALREGKEPGSFTESDQDTLRRSAEIILRIDTAEGSRGNYIQPEREERSAA